jgi:hypothetical protein
MARLRDSGRLSRSTAALSGNPTRLLQPETVLHLLDHTKIESTVRYLGVDIEDALALAEETEL